MSDLGRPSRKGPWAVGVAALLALAMVFVAPTSATAGRSATANKTGSAVVAKSDQGTLRSAISGTTSDGRRVSGTFTPMKFVEQDGALAVEGVIDGVIRGKGAPETFSAVRTLTVQEVNTPDGALPLGGKGMPGAAAAGACDILNLVLGPLDLDLLGLQVHLDQVVLDIVAQSGAGNLLGNLLCAVAGLLDPASPLESAHAAHRPAEPDPGCAEPGPLTLEEGAAAGTGRRRPVPAAALSGPGRRRRFSRAERHRAPEPPPIGCRA